MRRLALALIAVLLLTAGGAGTAEAKSCPNTYGGDVISASNMNCPKAREVVRTWAVRYRRDGKVNRRVLGFRCRDRSNPVEGLVVRCGRDDKSIRFYANVPR